MWLKMLLTLWGSREGGAVLIHLQGPDSISPASSYLLYLLKVPSPPSSAVGWEPCHLHMDFREAAD